MCRRALQTGEQLHRALEPPTPCRGHGTSSFLSWIPFCWGTQSQWSYNVSRWWFVYSLKYYSWKGTGEKGSQMVCGPCLWSLAEGLGSLCWLRGTGNTRPREEVAGAGCTVDLLLGSHGVIHWQSPSSGHLGSIREHSGQRPLILAFLGSAYGECLWVQSGCGREMGRGSGGAEQFTMRICSFSKRGKHQFLCWVGPLQWIELSLWLKKVCSTWGEGSRKAEQSWLPSGLLQVVDKQWHHFSQTFPRSQHPPWESCRQTTGGLWVVPFLWQISICL
jgi:hypothetical protein